MELNRDVTRKDILYGVLKRMDEVIDSISNTVSTKDFLVRDGPAGRSQACPGSRIGRYESRKTMSKYYQ